MLSAHIASIAINVGVLIYGIRNQINRETESASAPIVYALLNVIIGAGIMNILRGGGLGWSIGITGAVLVIIILAGPARPVLNRVATRLAN